MEFGMFVKNKKSKPLKTPGKPVKRGTENIISEMEKGLKSEVAKFADGTVLFRVIKMKADSEDLQEILMMLRE